MTVPLDAGQESRFQRLMEESIIIDLHQHPMVLPEDFSQYFEYLRSDSYVWGYDAVRAGGFTAVGTAQRFSRDAAYQRDVVHPVFRPAGRDQHDDFGHLPA